MCSENDYFRQRKYVSYPISGSSPPAVPSIQIDCWCGKVILDNGFSVVIQDNYYGDELNRMINYLHKYPVEVVVLCPDVETIKERERYREKTGYSGFTVETLYDTFMQTTPRIGFWLDNSNQTPQQTAETILNTRKPVWLLHIRGRKISFRYLLS